MKRLSDSPICFGSFLFMLKLCTSTRSTTEFKILLEALESPRLLNICHILTVQYVSDFPGSVKDTELLNSVLVFLLVKE